MMAKKRGRPAGGGEWQKQIMGELDEFVAKGLLIRPLLDAGLSQKEKKARIQAATALHRAGMVIYFRTWYPHIAAPNKRLRAYVGKPGGVYEDGTTVEEFVEDVRVQKVQDVWPGSYRSLSLVARSEGENASPAQMRARVLKLAEAEAE